MTDETITPPVRAGALASSLEIEYNREQYGEGGFTATGVHEWTFDSMEYYHLTGVDVSEAYVPQENGHSLRVVTEYTWMRSEYNGTSYTLNVETKGMRGSHSPTYYFTRAGHYRIEGDLPAEITRTSHDKQPFRQRESDADHFNIAVLTGHTVEDGETFVRRLHNGADPQGESAVTSASDEADEGEWGNVATPREEIQLLLDYDTPADALTVAQFKNDVRMDADTTEAQPSD
jgi:hypothetical protein